MSDHTRADLFGIVNLRMDFLDRQADVFDISIDYLVNGDKSEKAQQTIKDAELIKNFKLLDQLPEEEKKSILQLIEFYLL